MRLDLTHRDVELLKEVSDRWDTLSQDRSADECGTDHCHTELDDLQSLIRKIESLIGNRK